MRVNHKTQKHARGHGQHDLQENEAGSGNHSSVFIAEGKRECQWLKDEVVSECEGVKE
jgi:hypothetical protein